MICYPTWKTICHLRSFREVSKDIDGVGEETKRAGSLSDDQYLGSGLGGSSGSHQTGKSSAYNDEIVMHSTFEGSRILGFEGSRESEPQKAKD